MRNAASGSEMAYDADMPGIARRKGVSRPECSLASSCGAGAAGLMASLWLSGVVDVFCAEKNVN
jgi:hypothetical protein